MFLGKPLLKLQVDERTRRQKTLNLLPDTQKRNSTNTEYKTPMDYLRLIIVEILSRLGLCGQDYKS